MLTPQLEALLTDLSEREENLQPEEASLLEELEVLTMDEVISARSAAITALLPRPPPPPRPRCPCCGCRR
jgi:hypothetical protein